MGKLNTQSERLEIGQLKLEQLVDFHAYRSNLEVTKYQGFDVMNLEECEAFIIDNSKNVYGVAGQWVQYALIEKASGKLIGDCAIQLKEEDARIAEIGITVSHLHQNKGFAKEALLAVLKELFEVKDLHRIVAVVDAENEPSLKLMKSIGLRLEGYFIDNIFFKGKWGSEYQYALLKREWDLRK